MSKSDMNYTAQKAALTRAANTGDTYKVALACARAVEQWNSPGGYWPDDWSAWQRAFDDAMVASGHPGGGPDIEDLRVEQREGELFVVTG